MFATQCWLLYIRHTNDRHNSTQHSKEVPILTERRKWSALKDEKTDLRDGGFTMVVYMDGRTSINKYAELLIRVQALKVLPECLAFAIFNLLLKGNSFRLIFIVLIMMQSLSDHRGCSEPWVKRLNLFYFCVDSVRFFIK